MAMEVIKAIVSADFTAQERSPLLSLPAELRTVIFEHVFDANFKPGHSSDINWPARLVLDEHYRSSDRLQPLLTCRQIYKEAVRIAYSGTTFVLADPIHDAWRFSRLQPAKVASIRSIAIRADVAQLDKIVRWRNYPFDTAALDLDILTLAVDRPRILFGYTGGLCEMLRELRGVKRILFVCRQTMERQSLKSWYNLLVGTIMRVDHRERYLKSFPNPETVWWEWGFDEASQTFSLKARPRKPLMQEQAYMNWILPLMQEFRASVESEA